MGVNISGKGILSGIATLVVGVVQSFNLLASKIIGYTSVFGAGGSSYYTTTVGSLTGAYAKSSSYNKFRYLLDGATSFVEQQLPQGKGGQLFSLNNKFYTFGSNGGSISSDGITWIENPSPVSITNYEIGTSWSNIYDLTSDSYGPLFIIAQLDENQFVSGEGPLLTFYKSTDLENWYAFDSDFHGSLANILDIGSGRHFLVIDLNGDKKVVYFNNNFDTKVSSSLVPVDPLGYSTSSASMAFANEVLLAVSYQLQYIARSLDYGQTWIKYDLPEGVQLNYHPFDPFFVYDSNGNYRLFTGSGQSYALDYETQIAWNETTFGMNGLPKYTDGEYIYQKFFTAEDYYGPRTYVVSYVEDSVTNPEGLVTIHYDASQFVGWTIDASYYIDGIDDKYPDISYVSTPKIGNEIIIPTVKGGSYLFDTFSKELLYYPGGNAYGWGGTVSGQINTLREIQVSIGNQGEEGAEILAPVDVYTVPANTSTDIDQVTVKNNSLDTITYDLGVLDSGIELTDQNNLINDQAISAGATATITSINTPMTAGQRIVVLPSAVDIVEVKVYGTES
jgi:hypothetical protein